MNTEIDAHKVTASKLFNTPYSCITAKQRAVAKAWSYMSCYNAGEIKQAITVGQYPITYGDCFDT